MMNQEDAREYSESLQQIGSGWWRQVALAFRLGVHDALGLDRREWAERYHGYIRMDPDSRAEAARELTAPESEGGMGMTQREAGDVLGVSHSTIGRAVGADEPGPESEPMANEADEPELGSNEPGQEDEPGQEPLTPEPTGQQPELAKPELSEAELQAREESRREHEASVARERDIASAKRAAENIMSDLRSTVATIMIGFRQGAPALLTETDIQDLHQTINVLEELFE